MRFIRKKTWWMLQFLPVSIVVVLITLSIAPNVYTYLSKYSSASHTVSSIVKKQLPVSQDGRFHFLTGYTENEMFYDIQVNLIITRSFRDFKSLAIRIFNILLPSVVFGVFIYCLGYFIRRKKQNISVMAISMGGHAPPMIL